MTNTQSDRSMATLAGGCFWCLEAVFENVIGVDGVVSGYMGGATVNPTYEQVCTGRTGHAEVVQIEFDPQVISYSDLLEIFFAIHDPTTKDRQGNDIGTQYRSAIFFHDSEQQTVAQAKITELEAAGIWPGRFVTQIVPAVTFYPAEDYHQGYFRAHPAQAYCAAVVAPKVAKFRQKFSQRLKSR